MRSESFPFPDRFLDGPHGPLCYFDTGGAGTPIVMLHALGTNFTQFEYIAPALTGEARLIGLDLPGCGHSAKPRRPWRLVDVTAAVLRLLEHLGIERAVILGHSFGGRVALELALYKKLGPKIFKPNVVAGAILASVRFVLQHIFSKDARRTPRAQRFMHQVLDRYDPRFAWEFAYHACPLLPELTLDVIDELPRIKVPVYAIWGARDELIKLETVRPALSRLPRCELVRELAQGPQATVPAPSLNPPSTPGPAAPGRGRARAEAKA
jgi:pimeloyl-ACP methyl ester carboxylesterase